MIAEGKNPWGPFVEGQLIDWGIEWTKSHPNPDFFSERERAEVFCQALRLRRFAEAGGFRYLAVRAAVRGAAPSRRRGSAPGTR